MTRLASLGAILDLAVGVDASFAPRLDDAYELSLAAIDASWHQQHELAAEHAAAALGAINGDWTGDPVVVVTACAAAGLAAAGIGVDGAWSSQTPTTTPTGDPILDALPLLSLLPSDVSGAFAVAALAEAALSCARVGLAAAISVRSR